MTNSICDFPAHKSKTERRVFGPFPCGRGEAWVNLTHLTHIVEEGDGRVVVGTGNGYPLIIQPDLNESDGEYQQMIDAWTKSSGGDRPTGEHASPLVDDESKPVDNINDYTHLSNEAFRGLLTLHMRDDPSVLRHSIDDAVTDFLDAESRRRGYADGWVEAYHKFNINDEMDG